MRASFFTKFLYAADEGTPRPGSKALILDRFVAVALKDRHGWGISDQGPWSADTYRRWVELAATEASDASDSGSQVRPDTIELKYFLHGRQVELARKGSKR